MMKKVICFLVASLPVCCSLPAVVDVPTTDIGAVEQS